MTFSLELAALTLAAAQPAPAAAEATVLELFERICLSGGEAPAGFERAAWSDFPAPLRLMNTYDHDGTFLRNAGPPTVYVAQTRGAAHMGPGLETRCGVAAQGIQTEAIVARLSERARARPARPLEMGGVSTTMIIGESGAFTVTRVEDDWVIVRSLGIMIPAEMLRGGDRRRRGRRK